MIFVSFSELQTKTRNELENVFFKTNGMQDYVHPYLDCFILHVNIPIKKGLKL